MTAKQKQKQKEEVANLLNHLEDLEAEQRNLIPQSVSCNPFLRARTLNAKDRLAVIRTQHAKITNRIMALI